MFFFFFPFIFMLQSEHTYNTSFNIWTKSQLISRPMICQENANNNNKTEQSYCSKGPFNGNKVIVIIFKTASFSRQNLFNKMKRKNESKKVKIPTIIRLNCWMLMSLILLLVNKQIYTQTLSKFVADWFGCCLSEYQRILLPVYEIL